MFSQHSEDKMSSLGFTRPPTIRVRDVESGVQRGRPILGRVSRRGRIVLAALVCSGIMVLYFMAPNVQPYSEEGDLDMVETVPIGIDMDDYVVDEYGDHYYPNYPQDIPPIHPLPSDLVDPAALFPEVDGDFLQPPYNKPFPHGRLREIISKVPEEAENKEAEKKIKLMPPDAWSQNWKGPDEWDVPGPGVEKVQWEGFAGEYETAKEKKIRLERKEAVKRGFKYAWQKYKDLAWGHDEVKPVSQAVSNPFNNWGASIIDTLDTLLLLGLGEEYDLCRPHVNQLNFHWVGGRDWSQGYIAPEDELDATGKPWTVKRDRTATIPVFETGIRYLGGLLGAYDLSGDKLMLDRAIDVANILKRAFNTISGLPQGARFDPGYEDEVLNLFQASAAEVGSMSLELIRLSRVTGNREWFDLAQRVTDFLEQEIAPRSTFPPLIPMHFSPDTKYKVGGSFSFGAMADSYYEYLIKAYKLLGGGPLAEPYKRLYTKSIDAARKLLFGEITTVPGRDLFTIGKYEFDNKVLQTEHLTCFAGGMLGLGAKLLDRPDDMVDGERFTETCYWISAATKTGIQPENAWFYESNNPHRFSNVSFDGRLVHPPADTFDDKIVDYHFTYKDHQGVLRFNDDHTPVDEDSGRKGQPLKYYSNVQGNPVGTHRVTGYYINRPETIESVFYMYRLTGDKKWQEKGWKMFTSWMATAKVPGGISSIRDVTADPDKVIHGDNMESFIFAETFKYHYLLHSEPDLMSLDDYVLNTEAHPFLVSGEAGSANLWKENKLQVLGTRGEGTDAQKWLRHSMLEVFRRRYKNAGNPPKPPGGGSGPPRWGTGGRGGGGGMGGGGGNPLHRPQPGE